MHAIIRSTLYLFTFLFVLYCRVVFNAEYFMIFFSSNAIQVATTNRTQSPGNALERVQRVHEPADLWDITF